MGIFNQQPNYNQLYRKEKRGITSPQGPPGPPGPAGAQGVPGPTRPKGATGPTGPKGATGASGTGFNLTSDGNYDISNKKLTSVAKGTASNDAVTKNQLDTKLSLSGGLMTGNLDMNSNRIYNVAQPDGDNQPATKIWSENKFLDKSSGVMAGPLNMSNNKITHLGNATSGKDGVSRDYGDGRYVKKGGDTMTGNLALGDNYITGLNSKQTDYDTNQPNLRQEIIDWKNAKWEDRTDNIFYKDYEQWTTYDGYATPFYFMKQLQLFWLLTNDKDYATTNAFQVLTNKSRQSPPSESQSSNKYFNLFGMIATNMKDPNDATDGVNKQYLEKSHVKPSHYNNEFKYLMTNRSAWTDIQADSFNITKIDNLVPQDGNYHQYNHKVLYTTIMKDQQGGYSYKMGINCYQLDKDKDYTLCIEIFNSDYQLWHKSVATIDTTTSKGVSLAGFTVQKFSHPYTNSSGNTACMYYIKIIVNFQKTVSGTFYSLDLYVNIPQKGIDLNNYPKNWTNNWMIAYGVFGKVPSIDPQKTYDYHMAFDIKPTKVVYNLNLDMNRKKILNIAADKTKNNSAATVKMVKDLETKLSAHTKNNAYREIFEEFCDLSDGSNYKITINLTSFLLGYWFLGLVINTPSVLIAYT